jgi:hypothetical protein
MTARHHFASLPWRRVVGWSGITHVIAAPVAAPCARSPIAPALSSCGLIRVTPVPCSNDSAMSPLTTGKAHSEIANVLHIESIETEHE